jgi:hypothetical protein
MHAHRSRSSVLYECIDADLENKTARSTQHSAKHGIGACENVAITSRSSRS